MNVIYSKDIIDIAPHIPVIRLRLFFCVKLSKYQVETPNIDTNARSTYHEAGTSLMIVRIAIGL